MWAAAAACAGPFGLVYFFSSALSDSRSPFLFSASPVTGSCSNVFDICSQTCWVLIKYIVLVGCIPFLKLHTGIMLCVNSVLFFFSFNSVLICPCHSVNISSVAPNGWVGCCSLQYLISVIASLVDRPELPSAILPNAMPNYGPGPQSHPYLIRTPPLIWSVVFICICLTTQDKYLGSVLPLLRCIHWHPLLAFLWIFMLFLPIPTLKSSLYI